MGRWAAKTLNGGWKERWERWENGSERERERERERKREVGRVMVGMDK